MDKKDMIRLAELRLANYIQKLYGREMPLEESTITALHNFMNSGTCTGNQLFTFLMSCDLSEMRFMSSKQDFSLQDEDGVALELIKTSTSRTNLGFL